MSPTNSSRSLRIACLFLLVTALPAFGQEKSKKKFPRHSAQTRAKAVAKAKIATPKVESSAAPKQAAIAAATASAEKPTQPAAGAVSKPRLREEWLIHRRAYPYGFIPSGARLKAMEQLEERRREEFRMGKPTAADDPPPFFQRQTMQAAPGAQLIPANPFTWTSIGPQPVAGASPPFMGFPNNSGRISALAVDPRNSSVVYLGGAQGGIWKTTDGGQNWQPLFDGQPTLAIGAIALDPVNPDIVYVGTGEQTFSSVSYYGAGVFKSTDGGMTWTQLGNPPGSPFVGPFGSSGLQGGAQISSIAVHPTNTQILLAGVRISPETLNLSGVYRSTDGGNSWALMNTASGAAANEVLFNPTNPAIAYATLGSFLNAANGVYRSSDAGLTWTRINGTTVPSGLTVTRAEIAIAPSVPNTLYVGVTDPFGSSSLGIYKTTDGGTTWTRLSSAPDYCAFQCFYDNFIKVSPTNPNVVFAGGAAGTGSPVDTLWRTIDGGTTWQEVHTGANGIRLHVDHHTAAFSADGSVLYVGNDGGVWRSTNPAISPGASINWFDLNGSLSVSQYYPGHSVHPSTPNLSFGGTQDDGSHRYVGSLVWSFITGGDGGYTAINPAAPSTVLTTCQFICIFRSLQDGNAGTFPSNQSFENGIDFFDNVDFIPPLRADPNVPERFYFGTSRIYQTNNSALLWQPISPHLSSFQAPVISIAVAPSNSNIVYAATAAFTGVPAVIQRTANAGAGTGATWTDVTGSGLPPRFLSMLAVDPLDLTGQTVYAVFSGFSGFSGDTLGHIFVSTTGGNTWTDISGNFLNIPVNDIVVDPDVPNTIYIGTDAGVWFTNDANSASPTWNTLVTGLPRVAVFSLVLHRASRTLRAATHGRGVWDLLLGNLPAFGITSLDPVSAVVGGTNLGLTVDGNGFTSSSVVQWNGMPLTTIFANANRLHGTVPFTFLTGGPPAQITVFDPGFGTTNALLFSVLNPAPLLSSLSPSSSPANNAFTLTANGSNFVSSSIVQIDGVSVATTFVDSTQVMASVSASDIALAGTYRVTVFTPSPGGGLTTSQLLTASGNPPPNDNFTNAIVFSSSSFADTQNTGLATEEVADPSPSFSCVLANGAGRNNTIWYRITPASNVLAIFDTRGSVYDTVLSVWTGSGLGSLTQLGCDDDGIGFSGPSELSVNLSAGTTYHIMIGGWGGSDAGTTIFNATLIFPPANDNFANATLVNANPFTDVVNTLAATIETADPFPSAACIFGAPQSGRARSIWYRYAPTGNGPVTADTFGSNSDTILAVYTGFPGAFTERACNDDAPSLGTVGVPSQVMLNVTAGITYFFVVTAWDGIGSATSTFNLNATLTAPTSTVTTLTPSSADAGGPAFTLTVDGAGFQQTTSMVAWEGSTRVTTFVSSTRLTAAINAADVATGGTRFVTVVDPGGSSNAAAFTVTSFSLSANPTMITVTRGQSGSTMISVTPVGGSFSSAVTLSCLNVPSQATCNFNPASVTPGANPASSTLTITTTAPSALPPLVQLRWPAPPLPLMWFVMFAVLLWIAGRMAGKWSPSRRRWQMGFYGAAIFVLASLAVACGGGGGGGGGGGSTNPGTPRGVFTITVRGTSGSTTATTNVTLTVN